MKLIDAVKQYEECHEGGWGCLVNNCPLEGEFEIKTDSDFDGELTWKVEGCMLMAKFADLLEGKEAGTPIEGREDNGKGPE